MAANLGELMELKHEDAAVLIIGASHLVDLQQIYDSLDINYLAFTTPKAVEVMQNECALSNQKNEPLFKRLKNTCGRSRIPATVPPGPARPSAPRLPAPPPTATLRTPAPIF